MKTLTDLLYNLHHSHVMQIWGDHTITNVETLGYGFYSFDIHTLSHGERIVNRIKVQIDIDHKCAFLCTVLSLEELDREPCTIS